MAVGKGELPEFQVINGVRIGVAKAGIKYPDRKDLVVFELAEGCTSAGVFTKNAFCAAPVVLSKQNLASSSPRYLLINTGNANAGTGTQGMNDALQCCQALAELTQVAHTTILPFSTGVIGETLPVNSIIKGLPDALSALNEAAWADAAEGIMTTDTRPKGASKVLDIAGHRISISGVSKGAGMIMPNMATMLGFVATDAKIEQGLLQEILTDCAGLSFNRITIDGDTSTNDSCILVATGKSDAPELKRGTVELAQFTTALKALFVELAQAIVRDGEGATKFVSVIVESAKSQQEALDVAYTVAHSPLVKTALFACDPNWGRILAAVGRAGVNELDLDAIIIHLDEVCIVSNGGRDAEYTEEKGQQVMNREEITIRIQLGRGRASETIWTTDLSREYVTINAEYRS
ncbi:bifunctional glutamate N-acetyltransferase/amino-acid acetyltransferase ArgJ [Alkalimarinus alittae]|uniref:Arginine biosynthesis bifunctional protein ArgJ n=1 Tax=Alkalimarinus alittae TaxID=2961619 RepID=A0ABY6N0I2_9ALTE|nr:bifunctional glutamate N-acetyltransferase/amino-acid acetyltransferase ArgJ [Alkalimarinus alittae]UZE95550.1 bifunctional glutamate N-acetyltransferase/amino-acid acetyltransferase ArgJ [Alkalimarinus alittae]